MATRRDHGGQGPGQRRNGKVNLKIRQNSRNFEFIRQCVSAYLSDRNRCRANFKTDSVNILKAKIRKITIRNRTALSNDIEGG